MMDRLRLRGYWLGLGWVWVVGLVGISLFPRVVDVPAVPHDDKLGHVLAYFFVTLWFFQVYLSVRGRLGWSGFMVGLGILLEILQGLGGVRVADMWDVVANALGVGLAWIFVWWGFGGSWLVFVEQRFFKD